MSATTVPQPDKLAVRKIRIATATRIISKNLSRPVTAAWEQKVIGTCLEEVVDQSDQAFQTAVNIAQSRIQSEQSKIDSARAAIHSAAIHQIEALGKEPKTKSLAIHHWTSVDTDIILAHRDGSRTEEQLIFDLVCFAHYFWADLSKQRWWQPPNQEKNVAKHQLDAKHEAMKIHNQKLVPQAYRQYFEAYLREVSTGINFARVKGFAEQAVGRISTLYNNLVQIPQNLTGPQKLAGNAKIG